MSCRAGSSAAAQDADELHRHFERAHMLGMDEIPEVVKHALAGADAPARAASA